MRDFVNTVDELRWQAVLDGDQFLIDFRNGKLPYQTV
jgi:hypothetical protein